MNNTNSKPVVKLNSNEFPYKLAPKVQSYLQDSNHTLQYYPDDSCNVLRNKLSSYLGVNYEQILITSGSSEAISLIMKKIVSPESEVITSTHAFQLYNICAQQQKKKMVFVDETETGHQDLEGILGAINSNTSLIFLANPSNPLGTWIERNSMKLFLKSIPEHVKVVIDEAYFEFMDQEPTYETSISYMKEFSNVIIIRTFSKLYGLAGLRIGYVLSNLLLINQLKTVQLPFSVNSIAIECAARSLEEHNYYQKHKDEMIKVRRMLYEWLVNLGFSPLADSANFLTFRYGEKAPQLLESLEKMGIYVRGLANYNLQEYIRISIGTPEEIHTFLDVFIKLHPAFINKSVSTTI